MNVFRHDIGYVERPGEYPFRDGTITVTAAELAIWKSNPGAGFLLMRKHPIQERIAYVLGRQLEQIIATTFYQSSNGDSWRLTVDPRSGAKAVLHRPNTSSGGRVSYIDVDSFLREHPEGPQHQALRQLIAPHS